MINDLQPEVALGVLLVSLKLKMPVFVSGQKFEFIQCIFPLGIIIALVPHLYFSAALRLACGTVQHKIFIPTIYITDVGNIKVLG